MLEDKYLVCTESNCGNEYLHSVRDQEFFASKGFGEPKRCPACRKAKKQRMASPFNNIRKEKRGR